MIVLDGVFRFAVAPNWGAWRQARRGPAALKRLAIHGKWAKSPDIRRNQGVFLRPSPEESRGRVAAAPIRISLWS
jgi:hypothetical protein